MWIVRLALRRPYTFTVMAVAIVILGVVSALRMAKDIFPSIDIPVVTVVWTYGGMAADELESRVITLAERGITTTVNDVEHLESQSMRGAGIIKVFFHPGTSIDAAVAQITASSGGITRIMPPGITPPLIIRFSASNVPIIQLGLGSKSLTEQALYDLGTNFMRPQLATVQGASLPLPMGGKVRQIQVDLDPQALQANGLTPSDVTNAINAQNLTLPSGTAKIGDREYNVLVNSGASAVAALNDLPIKTVNGVTLYIRDVAQVRDGSAPQTNIVRQNGTRGALLPVLKNGNASTLDVISRIRAALPRVLSTLPPELDLQPQFDQSIFVRNALKAVIHEALIATALTSLLILLFLGSWRNTLVVALSIPLSIFVSIIVLSSFGQTINAMTLGGLALAVGILVDDATVTIENIDRNLGLKKPLIQAILDGAQQIAMPAFVATLCICIVFVPIFFLSGTAKYLFGPMAMAVIFAMLASYLLSRTVVPTFVHYLLHGQPIFHDSLESHGASASPEAERSVADAAASAEASARQDWTASPKPEGRRREVGPPNTGTRKPATAPRGDIFWRVHVRFNRHFERMRGCYTRALDVCLGHRKTVLLVSLALLVLSGFLLPFLGRDFFPTVDAGQFRLHVRAPVGLRVEETERVFTEVENTIRAVIPADELVAIIDNIGPPSVSALAFSDSVTVGTNDGEILVSLNPEKHGPTWDYVRRLRERLRREQPDCDFFLQPSDIVSQILNFGLPAPINVQIAGRDRAGNYAIAQQIAARIAEVRGAVDVHVHQIVNGPSLKVEVDRSRAGQLGLSQRDVASNLLIALSGTGQTSPNFWLNTQTGVQYPIVTQTPPFLIDSLEALRATPVGVTGENDTSQPLGNVANIERTITPTVASHWNIQPVFDVYANVDQRDLGAVADDVRRIVKEFEAKLPRASFITMRGQVQSMDDSFRGLGIGVLFAMVLVYLLMVVNFQSWLDPFIIIMALPGALCGIIWALLLTRTTLSVPSLMGAIMSIGVASANAILLVTFANDLRKEGKDARAAALEAGHTRLRPVLMTALAMIIGMLPMSLGVGEGGEQNAPLARAVIGGLLVATIVTLFVVPVVYASLRKKAAHRPEEEIEEELHEAHLTE